MTRLRIFVNIWIFIWIFLRNIAGAIRVGAGRKSVESKLAGNLTSRNHLLDNNFSAKTLMMKEKKKKKNEDADEDSDDSDEDQDVLVGEDGLCYVERGGVSNVLIM